MKTIRNDAYNRGSKIDTPSGGGSAPGLSKGKMRRVLIQSAMGISASIFALSGLVIVRSNHFNYFILFLILFMLAWAAVEFYIGFSRSIDGIAPDHFIIKVSRMLWSLCAFYSWFDLRNGWTRIGIPARFLIILLIVYGAGLLIRTWAVIHLGKSFSYAVKPPDGNVLITTGPYRFVRHPG